MLIKLIGVIARGGIPVRIWASGPFGGEEFLAGMLEAARALSSAMAGGCVRMMDFGRDKLIIAESRKGYTIVALADRAEAYIECLLRMISEEIDRSDIEESTGLVYSELSERIDAILGKFLRRKIEIKAKNIEEIFRLAAEHIASTHATIVQKVNMFFEHRDTSKLWGRTYANIRGSIEDAIKAALLGRYGEASAIALRLGGEIARILAIGSGLLASSMIHMPAPPLKLLDMMASELSLDDPFKRLAVVAVKYRLNKATVSEHIKALEEAIEAFGFDEDMSELARSLLFIDPNIGRFPRFAERLIGFLQKWSPTASRFIRSVIDRGKVFEKIYSITSLDEFKADLSAWKRRVRRTIQAVEGGKTAYVDLLLDLQVYLALLTALAESPVLPPEDRYEALSEVLGIYERYVRPALRSEHPLFSYSVMSIFQSVSVVLSELYSLATRSERPAYIRKMLEFLRDVIEVAELEWVPKRYNLSLLTVMTNAISPQLSDLGEIFPEEAELLYIIRRGVSLESLESLKNTRPYGYGVIIGNLLNTLVSFGLRMPAGSVRRRIISGGLRGLVNVYRWFLMLGVVCRDDIMTMTKQLALSEHDLPPDEFRELAEVAIALNKIAAPRPERYDYELAVISEYMIGLMLKAWSAFGDERFFRDARVILSLATEAWRKYGFEEKADDLLEIFVDVLGDQKPS